MSNVRETYWAEQDVTRYAEVAERFPAALETEMTEWQERVDNLGRERTWVRTSTLYVITAIRYEEVPTATGYMRQPVEPREERTYLVVADSLGKAWDHVTSRLEAQGYVKGTWALFAPQDASIQILEAN